MCVSLPHLFKLNKSGRILRVPRILNIWNRVQVVDGKNVPFKNLPSQATMNSKIINEQAKLGRVAEMMDEFTRNENKAYIKRNEELTNDVIHMSTQLASAKHLIERLHARLHEQEIEIEVTELDAQAMSSALDYCRQLLDSERARSRQLQQDLNFYRGLQGIPPTRILPQTFYAAVDAPLSPTSTDGYMSDDEQM